jgi:HprK-related kinase A
VILSDLPEGELARRIGGDGLTLECGPFVVRVTSPIPAIPQGLGLLYADYPVLENDEFADIAIRLVRHRRFARLGAPQVVFDFDGEQPFAPLPLAHAWPCFEWALNWSIASSANHYLVLHAAVLEHGGRALIMPGPPGSGKSTLCAALTGRGWRLLSDELTLVDMDRREIVPVPRPISLKNQSIQIIRNGLPGAVLSRTVHYTTKGSVAHLKPHPGDIRRAGETAKAGWIVFPRYAAGAPTRLAARSRADTVLELGNNSFNYHIQGRRGFEAVADIVEASQCYDLDYGSLDDAIATFERIAGTQP